MDERAGALREAADEIHTEARWQLQMKLRGRPVISAQWHIDRLLMVERILRDRAATLETRP